MRRIIRKNLMVPFLRPVHDQAVLESFPQLHRDAGSARRDLSTGLCGAAEAETLFRQADCILKDGGI